MARKRERTLRDLSGKRLTTSRSGQVGFLRRNGLLAILFITGAAVLVIEVAATRLLGPFFGNTIYTLSSVIGTILTALSIGYFVGGKLSDLRPNQHWFFGVIFAGGISVLVMQLCALMVLRTVCDVYSIISGPLISSLLLFFMPAALLGLLSPYGVKLQHLAEEQSGTGSVAGKVFFWSTLGSIFGSLASGLVLIPAFGVSAIVIACGILLALLGIAGLAGAGIRLRNAGALAMLTIGLGAWAFETRHGRSSALVEVDGVYEKVTILDKEHEGRMARAMFQDRTTAGAIFLDTGEAAIDYPKYYAVATLFRKIENALVIGAGMYIVPRMIVSQFPDATVDVAEIEPILFDLSKKYCGLVPSPRLRNHVTDGRRFLYESDKQYDLIFGDAYVSLTVPAHLATIEFFQLACRKLAPDGVFVANFMGDFSRKPPSMLMSVIRTMQTVFPNSYFFARHLAKARRCKMSWPWE